MRILTSSTLVFLRLLAPALSRPRGLRSDPVPVPLDIERTCRAAQDYGMNDPEEDLATACSNERTRAQLGQKWVRVQSHEPARLRPAHPRPSYVEKVLTCLEMDQNTLIPLVTAGAVGAEHYTQVIRRNRGPCKCAAPHRQSQRPKQISGGTIYSRKNQARFVDKSSASPDNRF